MITCYDKLLQKFQLQILWKESHACTDLRPNISPQSYFCSLTWYYSFNFLLPPQDTTIYSFHRRLFSNSLRDMERYNPPEERDLGFHMRTSYTLYQKQRQSLIEDHSSLKGIQAATLSPPITFKQAHICSESFVPINDWNTSHKFHSSLQVSFRIKV